MTILELNALADRKIAESLTADKTTPPCASGCFWCCKESVIADDGEVREALKLLCPEERERVATQTAKWLAKFREAKIGTVREPGAFKAVDGVPAYRSLNLWCPLLRPNGKCSVYAARPLACRVHIAHGSNAGCKDDEKREHQKFAMFPGFIEKLAALRMSSMADGETMITDHLGIILAKELLGIDEPTKARMVCRAEGDTITIEQQAA